MIKLKSRLQKKSAAFSLVEVAFALGIASFCLVPLFGILPTGLSSNTAAIEQTAAANIARSIIADLRATPPSSALATSSLFKLQVPAKGGADSISASSSGKPQTLFFAGDGSFNTKATTTGANGSRYRAAIGFLPPSSGIGATSVRVLITWAALADQTTNSWPKNFSGSYETVTALDRN